MSTHPPKSLACRCPLCSGRIWTPAEIRALPGVGMTVNGMTLRTINQASGHLFYYPTDKAVGTWHKAGDAPARAEEAGAGRHVWNSSEEARLVMPIDPKRLDLTFIAGGEA